MPDSEENRPDEDGIIGGFGGLDNIASSSSHDHDVFVTVHDVSLVDEGALKAAGATNIDRLDGNFKITFGPHADDVVRVIQT
ncbi:hypothetical protein [Streptomyces rochei]|uniref:hypothetical protein n=1 Tax=Streptomyces rochei TaxID=1928 RepID=UPI00373FC05E